MRICEYSPEYADSCPFRDKLDPIRDNLYQIFKNTSIGDFADKIDDIKDFVII